MLKEEDMESPMQADQEHMEEHERSLRRPQEQQRHFHDHIDMNHPLDRILSFHNHYTYKNKG